MFPENYLAAKPSAFYGWIGVAQADITPTSKIYSRNWGAAAHDVADGIHQPLMMGCIALRQSTGKPLVLITADLGCVFSSDDELFLRQRIADEVKIDLSRLMFCCSHTHSGPIVSLTHKHKPGGEYIAAYNNVLLNTAIQVAKKALSNSVPSTLTWEYGSCSLAKNRDLPYHPEDRFIVAFNPARKADDTLLVGRITDESGKITGTIVNYACHPTTLAWDNRLISPDYIGALRETVQSYTGSPCLFLQGASGDLAPAEQYSGETELAEKNGRQVAFSVLSILEKMLPPNMELTFDRVVESGAALGTWKRQLFQPSSELSSTMVKVPLGLKALQPLAEIEKELEFSGDRVHSERLLRKRDVRKAVGDHDIAEIYLWIWQVGDSFLVAQPNEAYSYYQQQVRSHFPGKSIAVMNLVNGGIGYLPLRELYEKDVYPAWQTPFAAGSLEQLTQVTLEVIRELAQVPA